jgi:hypothetical protein
VDVVWEITELYYSERDYRWGLCQVKWRHIMQKRRGDFFILGHFYIILNLKVERKSESLFVSNGL